MVKDAAAGWGKKRWCSGWTHGRAHGLGEPCLVNGAA